MEEYVRQVYPDVDAALAIEDDLYAPSFGHSPLAVLLAGTSMANLLLVMVMMLLVQHFVLVVLGVLCSVAVGRGMVRGR